MGPDNPLDILDVKHVTLSHGLEKTTVVYPDGIEVEFKIMLPASVDTMRTLCAGFPPGAWLCSTFTDDDTNGLSYAYTSYWLPCNRNCETCWIPDSGVTMKPCKLVKA